MLPKSTSQNHKSRGGKLGNREEVVVRGKGLKGYPALQATVGFVMGRGGLVYECSKPMLGITVYRNDISFIIENRVMLAHLTGGSPFNL